MKALKDCEWGVSTRDIDGPEWYWQAETKGFTIYGECWTKTKGGAKNHWKRFAELNGIKKWKFV